MLNRLIVSLVVIKVTGRLARVLSDHAYAAGLRERYDPRDTCPPDCCGDLPVGYGPR